jgi:acetylornithine deacetylase/succinyl-diaminopimelate desuccinylase-like protein
MPHNVDAVLAFADAELERSLARLFELIRIPSISTDPAYAADCRRAAEWLTTELIGLGFEASVRPTEGHPMVVGHGPKAEGPHVLFYGHYDVQPVDPLELWETPPFEPVLKPAPDGDTHIVARGASDDKGQLMTFVEACRAFKAVTGGLPVNVSMLFEGEEVEIACASQDLHSGMFGNAARNPLQVLAEIVASLRTPEGGVAIAGFYDGVGELPEAVKAQWARLPFDAKRFLGDVGLSIPAGEAGRSVLEQIWARPSCEINGISGGYTGEGFKTVIPAKAKAKISFRLVAGQDPDAIREAFRAHVRARVPADCRVSFASHGASPAIAMPADGPFLKRALGALTEEWGKEAAIAGTGGSIPVVGAFQRRLGMEALLVGFARIDNRIHSPNEKYDLTSFRHGVRSWIRILGAFGEMERV